MELRPTKQLNSLLSKKDYLLNDILNDCYGGCYYKSPHHPFSTFFMFNN